MISDSIELLKANHILPKDVDAVSLGISHRLTAKVLVNQVEGGANCASITFAETAVTLADPDLAPTDHALRHVGGKPIPTIPGVVEYSSVVSAVTSELADAERNRTMLNGGCDAQGDPEPLPTPRTVGRFDLMSVDGVCFPANATADVDWALAYKPLELRDDRDDWFVFNIMETVGSLERLRWAAEALPFVAFRSLDVVPVPANLPDISSLWSCDAFLVPAP